MFYMVGANAEGFSHHAMCLATSTDGVHWTEEGPVVDQRQGHLVFAGCVWRARDRFVMNYGSAMPEKAANGDHCVRFWESNDLRHWTYRGDDKAVRPDPRWYGWRWDCMDAIPRVPGDPAKGYWGYITGDVRDGWPHHSVGMLQSDDGVEWAVLPPPVIEWGGVPEQSMEVGSCERIGDKYYLILGAYQGYLGQLGYCMYTFVSDDPAGPFRPDVEAFRLSGTSHKRSMWLARFCRIPGATLFTNYTGYEVAGKDVWFQPMKRAAVDAAGHLRLHYWEGNDAMKGRRLPVDLARCEQVHAGPNVESCAWKPLDNGLWLQAKEKGLPWELNSPNLVLLLENRLPPERGLVLEATVRMDDSAAGRFLKTHSPRGRAGIYIEETPGTGAAALFGTYGITEIGRIDYRGGTMTFETEDVTGPGCATPGGIPAGRSCSLRFLLRRDMIELYLNDLFVQAFRVPVERTGRVGFIVQNGTLAVDDLRAWLMTF
jgi:hypothetical protein